MYFFPTVTIFTLIAFIFGFATCSLLTPKKKDQKKSDLFDKQKDNLNFEIKNLHELVSGLYGKTEDYVDIIKDQKEKIDSLTQQIKDMQIIRTKPLDETVNILNENFFRNATFFAENNHDVFIECIRAIILETFIKEIIVLGDFTYRVKMENEEIHLLKTPEKLVYFVKESYDLKKSLNAIRKN